ncbi:MAG: transposase [Pirellulales bacterium]
MRSTAGAVGTLQGSSIRDDSSHSIRLRQIEYELRHAIDFMWLSSGREIDHTTLSEFRRKHADQLRDIFNQVIRRAIDLGVAKLSSLCIDGTRVLADANRYKTWTTDRLARA